MFYVPVETLTLDRMRSSAKGTTVGILGCISALPQRKAVLLYIPGAYAPSTVGVHLVMGIKKTGPQGPGTVS